MPFLSFGTEKEICPLFETAEFGVFTVHDKKLLRVKFLYLKKVTTSVISTFGGDRTVYRIEAVWDSSLHNSELLNKPGGKIWLTISAYLEIQNCSTPVCISRDICTQVFPRDARLGHCRRNGISNSHSKSHT